MMSALELCLLLWNIDIPVTEIPKVTRSMNVIGQAGALSSYFCLFLYGAFHNIDAPKVIEKGVRQFSIA